MIRIAVVGDIGSGKSYVAKQFGYPVFNADLEVNKLYKKVTTIPPIFINLIKKVNIIIKLQMNISNSIN